MKSESSRGHSFEGARRLPRALVLLVFCMLCAPVSCGDKSDPERFTTTAECSPGDKVACEGEDGHVSNRLCVGGFAEAGDGEGYYSPCDCGGCLGYPDCRGCDPSDCMELCLCETQGAADSCAEACDVRDSGSE